MVCNKNHNYHFIFCRIHVLPIARVLLCSYVWVCVCARTCVCVCVCRLQKDWQTPPAFPYFCGMTGANKREDSLPLHYHFTAQQKPIPPSPRSEREKRGQRSPPPPPQPPLTNNEENTTGRRWEGWRSGGGKRVIRRWRRTRTALFQLVKERFSPAMGRCRERNGF